METPVLDPYIKLSRIRDDYGIEGRQGTTLKLSELDEFTPEQLQQLCSVLTDECQDIDYQIRLEMKRCEKDARWMYGCKNSLKARERFIERIHEIQGVVPAEADIAIRFMQLAKQGLEEGVYATLLTSAQGGRPDVFSMEDIG